MLVSSRLGPTHVSQVDVIESHVELNDAIRRSYECKRSLDGVVEARSYRRAVLGLKCLSETDEYFRTACQLRMDEQSLITPDGKAGIVADVRPQIENVVQLQRTRIFAQTEAGLTLL
jgi:hypothetical protein